MFSSIIIYCFYNEKNTNKGYRFKKLKFVLYCLGLVL